MSQRHLFDRWTSLDIYCITPLLTKKPPPHLWQTSFFIITASSKSHNLQKVFFPFAFYDGKAAIVSAATQINGVKKSDAGLFIFFHLLQNYVLNQTTQRGSWIDYSRTTNKAMTAHVHEASRSVEDEGEWGRVGGGGFGGIKGWMDVTESRCAEEYH